jgi:tricorn protease
VVTSRGYLRFPHVTGDQVAFVAADDVWLAPSSGGRAWRFTADAAPATTPRFSADGSQLAWASGKHGGMEVYAAGLADGSGVRLTYWGAVAARVCGWTPDGEVIAVSAAGQPFLQYPQARALGTEASGGPGADRILPLGPVTDLSVAIGADGAGTVGLLTGAYLRQDPAHWKRYRGGSGGRLWIGPANDVLGGAAEGSAGPAGGLAESQPARRFRRLFATLPSQFASPMLVAGRLAFISDHEGTGNIYSCAPDGTDLRRHTDHDGWYARQASTDGQRVVYMRGGELWLLPDLDTAPERLDVILASPVSGRAPRLISAADHVGSLSVDAAGTASAVEVRGTVHWLAHRDGPSRSLAVQAGVRARYPRVLGRDGLVVWASDAGGQDCLEIGGGDLSEPADPSVPPRRLAAGQLGRIAELAAAPDGSAVAVAAYDGRLRVVDVSTGQVRELAASGNGRVTGLSWSPDSAWLAWSQPAPYPAGMTEPRRLLRLATLADGRVTDVTDGRFTDTEPVFTLDGRHLAFLSRRSFDPVYDAHFFDLSFPFGARPYLVPLAAETASPFGPQLGGRPIGAAGSAAAAGAEADSAAGTAKEASDPGPAASPAAVDLDGIADRVVAVPVPESRYSQLRAVKDGLAWLREPVIGTLGVGGARPDDDAPRPVLERFDFGRREVIELADDVDWFEASQDGTRVVVSDDGTLTVLPADRKAGGDNPDDHVRIDASRARFTADPAAMWRQAYTEAARIMRHDFWVEDLADVDFDAIQTEYRPLLDRVTTQAEFADVLWELFGELGTSHAYARLPAGSSDGAAASLLGADLELSGESWRVTRVVRGESSDPRARSPLAAPGARIAAGDALVAIDGLPISASGPGPLLAGSAGKPVEVTIESSAGGQRRSVAIVPLGSDRRLRYLDWVMRKRAEVRELSGGRAGYLHVPDMVGEGWADFHRDLRNEMLRDALVIDVRANAGGHTSQLIIEKLARRVIGWDVPRGMLPSSYPEDAPRGPVVALTDECAGSDGDIVTAAIKILGLGPVVGARTWGGVIGYDDQHELIEGTLMTVPRFGIWFDGLGWGVENHGVDPDVEVIPSPDDWAAGRDVQLETAVRLALEALTERPAVRPPDTTERPSRRRPPLPPRSQPSA